MVSVPVALQPNIANVGGQASNDRIFRIFAAAGS
jgi:hypothetical protein